MGYAKDYFKNKLGYRYLHSTSSSFENNINSKSVGKYSLDKDINKQEKREILFYQSLGLNGIDDYRIRYKQSLNMYSTLDEILQSTIKEIFKPIPIDDKNSSKFLTTSEILENPNIQARRIEETVEGASKTLVLLQNYFDMLQNGNSSLIKPESKIELEKAVIYLKRISGIAFDIQNKSSIENVYRSLARSVGGRKANIMRAVGETKVLEATSLFLNSFNSENTGAKLVGGSKNIVDISMLVEHPKTKQSQSFGISAKEKGSDPNNIKIKDSPISSLPSFLKQSSVSFKDIETLQFYLVNYYKLSNTSNLQKNIFSNSLTNKFEGIFEKIALYYLGTDYNTNIDHVDFVIVNNEIIPKSSILKVIRDSEATNVLRLEFANKPFWNTKYSITPDKEYSEFSPFDATKFTLYRRFEKSYLKNEKDNYEKNITSYIENTFSKGLSTMIKFHLKIKNI